MVDTNKMYADVVDPPFEVVVSCCGYPVVLQNSISFIPLQTAVLHNQAKLTPELVINWRETFMLLPSNNFTPPYTLRLNLESEGPA